jgi:hypothetical protein
MKPIVVVGERGGARVEGTRLSRAYPIKNPIPKAASGTRGAEFPAYASGLPDAASKTGRLSVDTLSSAPTESIASERVLSTP